MIWRRAYNGAAWEAWEDIAARFSSRTTYEGAMTASLHLLLALLPLLATRAALLPGK